MKGIGNFLIGLAVLTGVIYIIMRFGINCPPDGYLLVNKHKWDSVSHLEPDTVYRTITIDSFIYVKAKPVPKPQKADETGKKTKLSELKTKLGDDLSKITQYYADTLQNDSISVWARIKLEDCRLTSWEWGYKPVIHEKIIYRAVPWPVEATSEISRSKQLFLFGGVGYLQEPVLSAELIYRSHKHYFGLEYIRGQKLSGVQVKYGISLFEF